jgi:hypothetical protein
MCTTCGKFGHYKEGCQEKRKDPTDAAAGRDHTGSTDGGNSNKAGSGREGPWRVVQKQKRARRAAPVKGTTLDEPHDFPGRMNGPKIAQSKVNAPKIAPGSRFVSLMEIGRDEHENREDNEVILMEMNMEDINNNDGGGKQGDVEKSKQHGINRRGINSGGVKIVDVAEKTKRDNNVATRGGGSEKIKMGVYGRKGNDVSTDKEGGITNDVMMGISKRFIGTHHAKGGYEGSNSAAILTPISEGVIGPKYVSMPNIPRPPNRNDDPRPLHTISSMHPAAELDREGEVFLDANETGSNSSYETDMDIVAETPGLGQ